jgi:hypothetical protein
MRHSVCVTVQTLVCVVVGCLDFKLFFAFNLLSSDQGLQTANLRTNVEPNLHEQAISSGLGPSKLNANDHD